MRAYKAFVGIGKVSAPLGVVDLGDDKRLLVKPWAAFGTDLVGLGLATGLLIVAKPLPLKIAAGIGGAWMLTALVTEIVKLSTASEAVAV